MTRTTYEKGKTTIEIYQAKSKARPFDVANAGITAIIEAYKNSYNGIIPNHCNKKVKMQVRMVVRDFFSKWISQAK